MMLLKLTLFVSCGLALAVKPNKPDMERFLRAQRDNFVLLAEFRDDPMVATIETSALHSHRSRYALKAKNAHIFQNSRKRIYTKIFLWEYSFSDTARYRLSSELLENCLNSNCDNLNNQDSLITTAEPGLWIWAGDRIVVARTACGEETPEWESFSESLIKFFVPTGASYIQSSCGIIRKRRRS
jgi:hypothetical protein